MESILLYRMPMDVTQGQDNILLEVRNLKKYFPVRKGVFSRPYGYIKAVDDVSFKIGRGRTLGLVGESGCGKTTTGLAILRLIEPTEGQVSFSGKSILSLNNKELRLMRRHIQIIFQDPYGSLNPRLNIGEIVGEPFSIHKIGTSRERSERIKELLDKVGLSPQDSYRYPYEFSGGQRQRIGIARAIALRPEFIVCDEPVSALDVSIQAQIINLLKDLQDEFNLSYLFIAHDLSVVRHISDEVAVMYLGKIVEQAECTELYQNPLHPYTEAILSASPVPSPKHNSITDENMRIQQRRQLINEDSGSIPLGCSFAPRCPRVRDVCKKGKPKIKEPSPNHYVRCFCIDEYVDSA